MPTPSRSPKIQVAVLVKENATPGEKDKLPRQFSTGGKTKLLGISKRGNPYLRRLFIHGARSVAMHLNRNEHAVGTWMNQLESRAHHNVFVVALATKLARIAWAVLAKDNIYRPLPEIQMSSV